jgi:hypothetical protein
VREQVPSKQAWIDLTAGIQGNASLPQCEVDALAEGRGGTCVDCTGNDVQATCQ